MSQPYQLVLWSIGMYYGSRITSHHIYMAKVTNPMRQHTYRACPVLPVPRAGRWLHYCTEPVCTFLFYFPGEIKNCIIRSSHAAALPARLRRRAVHLPLETPLGPLRRVRVAPWGVCVSLVELHCNGAPLSAALFPGRDGHS